MDQTFASQAAAPDDVGAGGLSRDIRNSLSTAMIADSLDSLGARHQVARAAIAPVWQGARMFGRAATIQLAPTEGEPDDPYRDMIAFVDGLVEGSVAVVAAGGDDRTAYWGELFSAAALGRGAAGTIVDGPARDINKIRALGYPVHAAGSRPIDYRGRMKVIATGATVNLGGVLVEQGDLVVADEDGTVVVPKALEIEVMERAKARLSDEGSVLGDLVAGATLGEVWARWGVL